MKKWLFFLLFPLCLYGENPFQEKGIFYVLTDVTLVPRAGEVISPATVVVCNSQIVAAGKKEEIPLPPRSLVYSLPGKWVYPALIDLGARFGWKLPSVASRPHRGGRQGFVGDLEKERAYRQQGFAYVVSHPGQAVFAGRAVLVKLGEEDRKDRVRTLPWQVVTLFRFPWGKFPCSLMGAVAHIRQSLYDALYYREAREKNLLPFQVEKEALLPLLAKREKFVFQLQSEWDCWILSRLLKEFSLSPILLGSGKEYRRLAWIRKHIPLQTPWVLPLPLPKFPSTFTEAEQTPLRKLRHLVMSPRNPAELVRAGYQVAFTIGHLPHLKDFKRAVRWALRGGLSKEALLRGLTEIPAKILGKFSTLGTVEKGKMASFVVTNGELFVTDAEVIEVWIEGKRYEVSSPSSLLGKWRQGKNWLVFERKGKVWKAHGFLQGKFKASRVEVTPYLVRLWDEKGRVFEFLREKVALRQVPEGRIWEKEKQRQSLKKLSFPPLLPLPLRYPSGMYGRVRPPLRPHAVLFRGGTLWTAGEKPRVLKEVDLLVVQGKIRKIGKGLIPPPGALIVDCRGKHLTPGIIDAHSHIAVRGGVNEGSLADVSFCRVEDALFPDHIAIFWELAGGVTTCQVMHGSANPIGGQNVVIKLRWGETPEELIVREAFPLIKFALGENVKWKERYPSTRMGVEAFLRERFRRAKLYGERRKKKLLRRDLRLEALWEVLSGKRKVQCHSYRQDEILWMMRVAEDFGFQIGTFQHALEAYKVGREILKHGAGVSTFSDWWAYKPEAFDAIPQNASLLFRLGVVVSLNSDSAEMARHLNVEAAKMVKYGSLTPLEALQMITYYPAVQLGIHKITGSLEVGKDADIAIWNGPPLSSFSRCVETWIDGMRYFEEGEAEKLFRECKEEKKKILAFLWKEVYKK